MIRLLDDRVLVLLDKPAEMRDASGYTYQPGTVRASGIIGARPAGEFDKVAATNGIVAAVGLKRNQVSLDDVRSEVWTWFVQDEKDGNEGTPAFYRQKIDRLLMKLKPAPFDVMVGNMVIFPASAGEQIKYRGHDYVILREPEILAVVPSEFDESIANVEVLKRDRGAEYVIPIPADRPSYPLEAGRGLSSEVSDWQGLQMREAFKGD